MSQPSVPLDRALRRKHATVVLSAALLLVGGGAAWAYWTAAGTGGGNASTGTTVGILVKQTSMVSDLRPDGAAQPLNGTFDNPNQGPVYVTSVTATISGVTKAADAPAGGCTAADYVIAGSPMTIGRQIPAGTSQGTWAGATVQFANAENRNQDGCKGATLTFAYSSD